ncbi:hypothetical protein [Cohnella sp. GCM10027633]|uniref:hypothetical protein n=1 Tax=unclassified Cohnella TaxID=2636738 RepID=UPI003641E68C
MKRIYALTLAASLCLAAGCSGGPSADRYVGSADPAVESKETAPSASPEDANATEIASADPGNDPSTEPAASGEQPAQASSDAGEDAETPVATKAADKPVPTPRPAKENRKDDEKTNEAAVGSILNDSEDASKSADQSGLKLEQSIEGIRDLAKELKAAAEDEDAAAVSNIAGRIAGSWSDVKDKTREAYPDSADFIQGKIDDLSALTSRESLDFAALLQLDYELYQAFRQLSDQAGG